MRYVEGHDEIMPDGRVESAHLWDRLYSDKANIELNSDSEECIRIKKRSEQDWEVSAKKRLKVSSNIDIDGAEGKEHVQSAKPRYIILCCSN